MEDLRKVEILENGVWTEIPFSYLRKGNVFRMFESTGERVSHDKDVWTCSSDAYINKNGVEEVEMY